MDKRLNFKRLFLCLAFMLTALISMSAQSRKPETFEIEGKIGPYPVHMELTFYANNTVRGTYTYDRQVANGNYDRIYLEGSYSGDIDNARMVLMEFNPQRNKAIGTFECKIEGGYGHEGRLEMHYLNITGSPGYRNYKSGKAFMVDLAGHHIYPRY